MKLATIAKSIPEMETEATEKVELTEEKKNPVANVADISSEQNKSSVLKSKQSFIFKADPDQLSSGDPVNETSRKVSSPDNRTPVTDERYSHDTAPLFPDFTVTAIKEEYPEELLYTAETKPQKIQKINSEIAEDVLQHNDVTSRQVSISPEKRKYLSERVRLLEKEIQESSNITGSEVKAKKQELSELLKFLSDYK